MKLEYVKLHEIEEADVNPKDHDIGEIYMSMKRFGFTEPPVRNETTGKLVAGHGRIETLKVLEGEDITKPPTNIKLDEEGNWLIPVIAGIHFESDDEIGSIFKSIKEVINELNDLTEGEEISE